MKTASYIRLLTYALVLACGYLVTKKPTVTPVSLVAPRSPFSASGEFKGLPRPAACPFGHRTTQAIPVMYGHRVDPHDLERKYRNFEAWNGGGVIGPWNLETKWVCKTCRFAFDDFSSEWSTIVSLAELRRRREADPSDVLLQFPLPMQEEESNAVWYEVSIKDSGKWSEECRYWISSLSEPIRQNVRSYLEGRGVAVVERRTEHGFEMYGRYGFRFLKVLVKEEGMNRAHVTFRALSWDAAAQDYWLWTSVQER
jgi:hypothetical protein